MSQPPASETPAERRTEAELSDLLDRYPELANRFRRLLERKRAAVMAVWETLSADAEIEATDDEVAALVDNMLDAAWEAKLQPQCRRPIDPIEKRARLGQALRDAILDRREGDAQHLVQRIEAFDREAGLL